VVAAPGREELAEEARAILLAYASALGVELPPLLVEVAPARGEAAVERLEGEGQGRRYRLTAPVGPRGHVDERRLREALLVALEDAGLLRRQALVGEGVRARASTDGAAEGEARRRRQPPWEGRGGRTTATLPDAEAPEALLPLRDALSKRGLGLLCAKPYPAAAVTARRLDSVGEAALQQPRATAALLARLAAGVIERRDYVMAMAPPGVDERQMAEAAQVLAGAQVVAGVRYGHRRLYLRLPQGCEGLLPYLEGEWLERAVARALLRALGHVGRAGRAATRVAVRLPDAGEAEMDVVVLVGDSLIWAECALRPANLLRQAGRRRIDIGGQLLPDDRRLVATVHGSREEMEELERVYGCPAWQLGDGLGGLRAVLGLGAARVHGMDGDSAIGEDGASEA